MSTHPFVDALTRRPDIDPAEHGFELVDIIWIDHRTGEPRIATATGHTTAPNTERVYALANGDLILIDHTGAATVTTWAADTDLRIISGEMERIHRPGVRHPDANIDPTAYVHPTAHIGPNATIGRHTHIGPHTWIGAGAHIGDNTEISDGAFIGRNAHLGNDSRVGRGAAISTNTAIGPRSMLGAGSSTARDAYLEPGSTLGAGQHQPRHRATDPYRIMHLTSSFERLMSIDRD